MKKFLSILLAVVLVASVSAVSFGAITYNHADGISYSVSTDTPTCEEAIEACGGTVGEDTQTVYFQLPADDPEHDDRTWTNENSVLPGSDHVEVCVYWWGKGVGTTWPDDLTDGKDVAQVWVGYRATLVDPANRIYRAVVPNDGGSACIVWNNGVNAGMDETAPIFKYGRQLQDINIEGGEEGDDFCYDNLPEGTPNEDDCDGCITVANWSRSTPNNLTHIPSYGADWYIYYGNGCYGKYNTDSDNFESVQHNCCNPEHHHCDVNLDETVDATDVVAMQRDIVELQALSEEGAKFTDVDGDGEFSIMDATRIQRFLAEMCNIDGSKAYEAAKNAYLDYASAQPE